MSSRFASLPPGPASHFRLVLFGTILRLAELAAPEDRPDFQPYLDEAATLWGDPQLAAAAWQAETTRWAEGQPDLPFARLANALPSLAVTLIATMALIEEDPRLARLIESDSDFATFGGLTALWRHAAPGEDGAAIRDLLLEAIGAGLIAVDDRSGARIDWQLRLPHPVHDLLSGARPRLEGSTFEPNALLPDPAAWIGEADPAALAAMLNGDSGALLLVRGPRANGRRTLLRTAAGLAGRNVLAVTPALLADPAAWRTAGALAWAGNAMILAEITPGAGETVDLPSHPLFAGPFGIVTGTIGGIRPPGAMPLVAIHQAMPDAAARIAHWRAAGCADLAESLSELSLTSGNIRRVVTGAESRAKVRENVAMVLFRDDVLAALRDLRDAGLDALATPLDRDTPDPLQLDAQDVAEFQALLLRCKHRESLGKPGGGRGVRALFAGPSGTGKTLAARHIAASLGKDLYRIDLSATVSKFIGETEKSLERALSAAESLNIVLLLDEGDALMARRTDVSSSNDRYANLETNFLLQRIENFDGILLVTSNDADRIDPAFARRMDAVLTFRPPDEVLRHEILRQLLGDHAASPGLLHEVSCRCALSGGQLRNIALHARLLALDSGGPVGDAHLRHAVAREYRKTGDYCPLKLPLAAVG